jgi:hypothetical protein
MLFDQLVTLSLGKIKQTDLGNINQKSSLKFVKQVKWTENP